MKGTHKRSLFWLLGVVFVLLSAAAGAGWLYGPEVSLMAIAQSKPSNLLDTTFGFFSTLGGLEVTGALLLALAAGLFLSGRQRLAGRLLFAFLVTGALEYLLKQFLPVPPIPSGSARTEDFAPLLIVADHSYPYPSGHALRSVIIFGALCLLSGNWFLRAGFLVVMAGTATSRVYFGVHWPSDVVGGALLGAAGLLWAFSGKRV